MSKNRRFGHTAKTRLIVSIEECTVEQVDHLIRSRGAHHPARGNRSEFVRLAIEEKMQRECA